MFLHHISNDSEPVNDNICFFLGGEGRWNGTVLQALVPGAWHSILCAKTVFSKLYQLHIKILVGMFHSDSEMDISRYLHAFRDGG